MAFELDIGYDSRAGAKAANEDFCGVMLPSPGSEGMGAVAALADGVSEGGMGLEAAQTTVASVLADYYATPETWDTSVALDRIIAAQNAWLSGLNRRRSAVGLCTLTALVLRGHTYSLAHVGDCRAYLLRGGGVQRLTQDHVAAHPDLRHRLQRCVGLEDRLLVDHLQGELQVGDGLVLLSDGVHGVLSDQVLHALVQGRDAQAASTALTDAALQAGSRDNVTALVVRVLGLLESTLHDERRAASSLPIPPRLKPGQCLDGLRVLEVIADSGVNRVYRVVDEATQRMHVLKTLHPARAHDPDERGMLAHEAWLARRLHGSRGAAHLVALCDAPQGASAYYLLYDWHAGTTLDQVLQRQQPLAPEQAVSLACQALQALAHLHRQGVVHRDVKPANLHWGDDGVLRLLDLGVALSGREPESLRALHAGTPSYVNPEQWGFGVRGDGAHGAKSLPDARSDLFALGVTLYQLLTRKLPYGEVLPHQVGRYYRDPTPASRHNPQVPIWLDLIVQKAVARDQRQRFETAEEFLLALQRGASRPLSAAAPTPLLARDPVAVWQLALTVSLLFNALLVGWLLFLPR